MDLKINKTRLKTHWQYSKWYYVIAAVVFITLFNFTYYITTPKTPPELIMEIFAIGTPAASEIQRETFQQELLPLLSEDQVEVTISNVPLTRSDPNYYQIIMARFSTHEGDIIIIPRHEYEMYIGQGLFMSLEPYLDELNLPDDYDMEQLRFDSGRLDADNQPLDIEEICAIPIHHLNGLTGINIYSAKPGEETETLNEMVAGIPNYTDNFENALFTLKWLTETKQEFAED